MDLSGILSLVGTIGVIIIGMSLAGSPAAFIDPASFFIVFGGGFGTLMFSYPLKKCFDLIGVFKVVFRKQELDVNEVRPVMVSFAEKARREGLLALEDDLNELNDEFLQKGLQLVVDGTDPEVVEDIMTKELDYIHDRHKWGADVMGHLAGVLPAIGMIGTLIGLVVMLGNLQNPDELGPSMAVALITTFYGALLANVVAAPMEERLKTKNKQEVLQKELMIEGVLSIQSGDNPRIVEEKLKAYLKKSDLEEQDEEN